MAGLALGVILTSSIEKSAVDRAKNETAKFVAAEVDKVFPGMDFSLPMTGPRYEDFQKGVSPLLFNPSIKRIKVWNLDRVIVWSDERQLVGEQFPNDKELLKALNGTVSSEIISTDKPETRTERQYQRLLELYIPIRSGHEGKVRAVFEIYQDLEDLDADTSRQKRILWISIVAGFSGIYFVCFGIVWRASRRFTEQTLEIEKSEEKNRGLAQELTSLINNVPGIIYRGYRDWSLSFIGAEVEPVTGYTPDNFTSGAVGWKEIIHPDDMEQVKEAFRKADKEKLDTLHVEYRIRNKDGGIRWISDRRQLVYDAEGNFSFVDGLLLDITERKRAEEALRESEERFRDLVEHSQDLICTHDLEGRILSANPWPATVLGYAPDELLRMNMRDLLVPEVRHEFGRYLDEIRTHGTARGLLWVQARNGERRLWEYKNTLRTEGVAEPIVRGMAQDITERKHSEWALKESEGKFRVIFEGSKDGIILADVESKKFHTGNKTFCDMLQYTLDEIRQLSVADIHPEENLPGVLDAFERGVKQESKLAGDIPVRRKDGSVLWAEVTASPVTISGKKYLLGNFRDVTERRKADEALTRLGLAVDQATEAIVITDTEGTIQYVNPAFERSTGYSREEAVGKNPRVLRSGKHDEAFYRRLWDTLTRGEVWTGHFINRKKDGLLYEEDATISPLRDSSGKIVNYVATKRDVTNVVSLERQVRTAQRMESVGTLAGGIAHDFNNSLTGIVGFGELLRMRMAGDEQALHDLDEILRCAERAATLTRQLLTFARRQVIEPVNLNLSTLVADLMKLIGKVVGEHIEVKTSLEKNVPTIHADRGQIEQVVMNLCLNARDAMPEGGRLVVETGDVYLDEEYVRQNPYMRTGRYALLTVSDTGVGMDEKTRERVFEPFFTTKGPDKGTGLGLAMVYGIAKQHGGFIHLYSEPGKGTAFKVYFPAIEAQPDAVPTIRREEIVRGGTETILLAEDEEAIRSFIERALKELGYNVLVARNGEEAIEIFRQNKEIVLAVLDVVMPRKGGKEAFEEMHKQNPRLKVIFMSGYSANAIHDSFVLIPGTPFLQKPFGPTILARKIREVLDTQ